MSDTDETTTRPDTEADPDTEDRVPAATPEAAALKPDQDDAEEMFPRKVVEDLRQENGKYRQRAQQADALAQRLHTEIVRATGRLADPTDLPFDEDHLADADKMVAAIDDLLTSKPHLASRKPVGDIGQGNRGSAAPSMGLLDLLKSHT